MKWKTVTGYSEPQEVEVGKTTVYLRKNITEVKDAEDNDAFQYDECQMSLAEYEKYLEILASAEMSVILEKFEQQEQATADTLLNQMQIMETQSSQDETLANILLNQMQEAADTNTTEQEVN